MDAKNTLSCTPGSKTVGWFLFASPGNKKLLFPKGIVTEVVYVLAYPK
jgi:hypothetical protein